MNNYISTIKTNEQSMRHINAISFKFEITLDKSVKRIFNR